MFNYTDALNVATEFIKKANPDFWNGEGEVSNNFNTLIHTYDIGSDYEELDISFEYRDWYSEYEEGADWGHYCELRTKDEKADLIDCIFDFGIDSANTLAESIMETIYGGNWQKYM